LSVKFKIFSKFLQGIRSNTKTVTRALKMQDRTAQNSTTLDNVSYKTATNGLANAGLLDNNTRSSAIAERPHYRVRYSFRQK